MFSARHPRSPPGAASSTPSSDLWCSWPPPPPPPSSLLLVLVLVLLVLVLVLVLVLLVLSLLVLFDVAPPEK